MTRAAVMTLAGLLALVVAIGRAPAERVVDPRATPVALELGETPGAVSVSLLIQNHGQEDDRLLGGSTPLAQAVVVHDTILDDGVRQMVAAPDGLPVPAGATVILEPESGHVMLIGLREPLVQGQTFPLTLHFARAGDVPVTGRVRRKVDAAGITPIPPSTTGSLTISLVSAPPASCSRSCP